MATIRTTEELLAEEKRLKEEIERKHGKTPEQLYDERAKRIWDAAELREPDRVPVPDTGAWTLPPPTISPSPGNRHISK